MLVLCILNWPQCGIGMITKLAVTLTPRVGELAPEVKVSVPGYSVEELLYRTKRVEFEFDADQGWLEIDFVNKPALDQQMAVIIDQVEFFGITDPRFAWAGVFYPRYPEPWFSEQNPPPMSCLPQQTYLGWNGRWRLEFSVPVFTWIHRTLNLGWLYC